MPLKNGTNDEVISINIKRLIAEGYPKQQAIAIAMHNAHKDEAKKKVTRKKTLRKHEEK